MENYKITMVYSAFLFDNKLQNIGLLTTRNITVHRYRGFK